MRLLASRFSLLAISFLACGSPEDRTVLTVYSPHGRALLAHFEAAFERAHPTVDVQWVDMGSQEILDRVRAEAAEPRASVWFGGPSEILDRAARDGLLESYAPTWAGAVPADARGAGDRWFGAYLAPQVIVYSRDAMGDEEAPADWPDVLDARWKGRIVLRDPMASGSVRAIFGAVLASSVARTGSTAEGWEWLRRLDESTRDYVLSPAVLYRKLARREGVLTLYNMSDVATVVRSERAPLEWVFPRGGTPVLVDGIALVRGGPNAAEGRAYYEFVTSPASLAVAADSFHRLPARTDLAAASLPAWVAEARRRLTPMPGDRRMVADSLEAWMRRWDLRVRRRGGA